MKVSISPASEGDYKYYAEWFNVPENTKWLSSYYRLNPYSEHFHHYSITKRDNIFYTVYCDHIPVGCVNISNVDSIDKSGLLWALLGNKNYSGKGVTTIGINLLLEEVFKNRGLHSVWTWIAEHNKASIRLVEKNNFKRIGLQRECHFIDGRFENRFIFDIIAKDFVKINPTS